MYEEFIDFFLIGMNHETIAASLILLPIRRSMELFMKKGFAKICLKSILGKLKALKANLISLLRRFSCISLSQIVICPNKSFLFFQAIRTLQSSLGYFDPHELWENFIFCNKLQALIRM